MSGATATPESDLAPAVVLIVEDEEPIALALSFIVEDEGYIPLVASQGKEALKLARIQRPALVITDLMMPQMSGAELIVALRHEEAEEQRQTPIVLMTAAGAEFAKESGADIVLLKPFDVAAVVSLLHRFLD